MVDGKWSGKLKEGEADEEEKKKIVKLAKKFDGEANDAQIYGTKPRKVGDSWDVDPSKLDSFGGDTEDLKGTFKVTFKAVEKFQGEDCAVLVANFDVTGSTGKGEAKLTMKGKANIHRSLKHLVDLQNKMEGTVKMTGGVEGTGATMTMNGPMLMGISTVVK